MSVFFSNPKLHSKSFPHPIVVYVLIKLKKPIAHDDRCTILSSFSSSTFTPGITSTNSTSAPTTTKPINYRSQCRTNRFDMNHVRIGDVHHTPPPADGVGP